MKKTEKISGSAQHKKKIRKNIPVPPGKKKYPFLPVFIVFCVPVILYLQTFTFGFIHFDDDSIILDNIAFLSHIGNAAQAFFKDAFISGGSHFYRPLQTLSYMLDVQISGSNSAWIFHLTNILILGATSCLLFLFLKKLLIPPRLAMLSTLVYSVHPLFVSYTAWIPSRGDMLLTFFSLLSFLFLMEFMQKKNIKYFFLHWVVFTIALFCKETAAFLPFLFIIYFFIFSSEKKFKKKYVLCILLYFVSGIFFYRMRSMVIHDLSGQIDFFNMFGKNGEIGLLPLLSNIRTIPESLVKFFIPYDIAPIPGFSFYKTLTGSVILALLIFLFFRRSKRPKKEKIFCLSWFIFLLLPTLIYKNDFVDYLNHRFFLPLIGILMFLLFILPERWVKNGDIKRSWLIIAIIVLLCPVTFVASRPYSNPVSFFNAAVSKNPNSAFAYYGRGYIKSNTTDLAGALDDFSKAIKLKPDFAKAYNNRAVVYCDQGYYKEAVIDYSKAIEIKPDYAEVYLNRGITYSQQGSYEKAKTDFDQAVRLKPDYTEAYYNRGLTNCKLESFEKAVSDFTKTIFLNPRHANAYNNRGAAYLNLGKMDLSCNDFYKAKDLGSKAAEQNIVKFCHTNDDGKN